MDSWRPGDVSNPMSDAFRREAARNVQQNIASMRTQKDLKDAAGEEPSDAFESTAKQALVADGQGSPGSAAGQGTAAAGSASGTASTDAPAKTTPSEAGLSEGDKVRLSSERAGASGLLEERDPRMHRRRREEAKRMAEDGVPSEILQVSRQIVEGQLDPVRGPRDSLKDIKTPPDVGRIEAAPADYQPVMEIHDEGNHPLLDE